jgi:biopolymer transport protein ExbD
VRQRGSDNRQLGLISLMDVVFILLIFFLVSVFFASRPNEERKLFIPTPKNEAGSAQVLIQLIDDDSFFFVDPQVTEKLVVDITAIDARGGMSASQRLAAKRNILTTQGTFSMRNRRTGGNQLIEKVNSLVDYADAHPEEAYFVMIRCPGELPYSRVIAIIQLLSQSTYKNIQYGCVRGTIEDIQQSRRIERRLVREEGQIRKNVIIEF